MSINMTIFATGDSHSIFFHNSPVIKEHWLGFSSLPLTWFRLLHEGLDIYNIGNILGNGHETYNIKNGDHVLFYYGWGDIQKNIYKYAKNNYKEGIDFLITKYILLLIDYNTKYGIIPIVGCIYPNSITTEFTNATNLTINGTTAERSKYIKYANLTLSNKCKENNLKFFDIYDLISDEDNLIRKDYTVDGIHLDYNNTYLRNIIDEKLITLTNS